MKYRKKPVVIEAFQLKEGQVEFPGWFQAPYGRGEIIEDSDPFTLRRIFGIKTLEGIMRAGDGDWIIKGVKNEIYPCKPDIFEATYEAVE